MGAYYEGRTECPFDTERAIIFRIGSSKVKKKFWYYRIRRQDGTYFQKSTKETNKTRAMDAARRIYLKIIDAEEKDIVYGNTTFVELVKKWFANKTFASARGGALRHCFDKYLCPFFGDTEIQRIDVEMFKKYLYWRCTYWHKYETEKVKAYGAKRTPTKNTILGDRQKLIQFMKWACEKGYIQSVPPFPHKLENIREIKGLLNLKKTRGRAIDDKTLAKIKSKLLYWAFWDTYKLAKEKGVSMFDVSREEAEKWMKENAEEIRNRYEDKNWRHLMRAWTHRFARKRLYYFVLLAEASLARPSTELTSLRWHQVDFRASDKEERLIVPVLRIPTGKKLKERTAFCTYRSAIHLLRWRRICVDFNFGKDSDYVFPAWDGSQMSAAEMGRTFSLALKEWGLNKHPTGESITLYSIRNTAISNRLVKSGWDILQVATAADVSVLQISKAYAYELSLLRKDRYANTFKNEIRVQPDEMDEFYELKNQLNIKLIT